MAAQPCCCAALLRLWQSPCCMYCYIFVRKFLFNAHFDLEPDYIVRKPIRHRFQLYVLQLLLSELPYCQLFTHESNTFLTSCRLLKRIGHKCQKPCQKQPLFLDARGLPSNTRMSGPTPLTTPNDTWTSRSLYALPHNDVTKCPLGP